MAAAADQVAPPPQERAAQVGQPEASERSRVLGLVFAAALFVGVCLALGLSVEASFWVLVVLALINFFGKRLSRRQRRHLVRTGPVRSRSIPQSVKIAVATRDGGTCRQCGSTYELQYDHIVPYSLGGSSDDVSNIQLLCGRCNRRKSNRYVG